MRSLKIKQEKQKSEQLSPVNIRQTANVLHGMAHNYLLAIEAARKTARAGGKTACTGDMQRKRKALLVAHKMLMAMLGIEP